MDDMTQSPQHRRSRAGWRGVAVAAAVLVIVACLLSYSIAASYESLTHLAAVHHVPLARFFPVGLDGGLVGTIILDISLTWLGTPIGWLRQVARLFALGTVAANAASGWPDVVGAALRVAAPVLIVIIFEAVRTRLLRQVKDVYDPVPLARWLLAPPSTFRLWRRMKLWRISSYSNAVDMEQSRLRAVAQLTDRYGNDWARQVPGDLAWMLRAGVKMDDALAMVAQLTAPPQAQLAPATTPRRKPATSTRKPPRTRAPQVDPELADLDSESAALKILADEPGISGSALGRRIGKSPAYGRMLKGRLTDAPASGEIPAVR